MQGSASDEGLLKAVRAIRLKEYPAAARVLADYLAANPASYVALDLAAFCALHTADYDVALTSSVRCTTLKPKW
jgi:hypothetical protein